MPLSRRHLRPSEATRELSGALTRHMLRTAEEHAAKWTAEKRKQAEKDGNAMPGGKYPIVDQQDIEAAAKLIGSGDAAADAVEEHIKRMAKKHGLKVPQSVAGS